MRVLVMAVSAVFTLSSLAYAADLLDARAMDSAGFASAIAESGKTKQTSQKQLIAAGIAKSDSHVFYWYSDSTVSSGTSNNATAYRNYYTSQQSSTNKTLIAAAIAGDDHVYYWYSDGTISSGISNDPTRHRGYYRSNQPRGDKKLIAAGIASDDHVYYWYSDGTVSSGTTNDPVRYRGYYRSNQPMNKTLLATAIAGDDHVYYWYSDGTVSSGTSDNPTRYRDYYLSGQVRLGRAPDQVNPEQLGALHFGVAESTLYVNSFTPVQVQAAGTLRLADLEFVVPGGPSAGSISLSKQAGADDQIMLLAGYKPGNYRLQAKDKNSGQVVAEVPFTVTSLWPDDQVGPKFWTAGRIVNSPRTTALNSPTSTPGIYTTSNLFQPVPDNHAVHPHTGNHEVAVVIVDTSDERIPDANKAALRTRWREALLTGLNVSGAQLSVSRYYRESSFNKFRITGEVYGPVSLSGSWTDYFVNTRKPTTENPNPTPKWEDKSAYWDACAQAVANQVPWVSVSSLVCVVQSDPSVANRTISEMAGSATVKISDKLTKGLKTVHIPAEKSVNSLVQTLAHELGHNIDLGDVYAYKLHPSQIRKRMPGGWALMGAHWNLPHLLLVHRLRLDWIDPKKIRSFDLLNGPATDDKTVTLYPMELGNPPAGTYHGVEIHIAEGWNYYCSYRRREPSQIGDQMLPTDNVVVCTDVTFDNALTDGASRRGPVLMLPEDGDGGGATLAQGQDYKEWTAINNTPRHLRLSVPSIDAANNRAQLRVEYSPTSGLTQQTNNLDVSIQPWSHSTWQSPDIEVSSEKSKKDARWKNMPWPNHINTITAQVRNTGKIEARNVVVNFYVKDYTLVGRKNVRQFLGRKVVDILPGQTEPVSLEWTPYDSRHVCLVVEIEPHSNPDGKSEVFEDNNLAQSNYTRVISETSSPGSREVLSMNVNNPYDTRARVEVQLKEIDNPLYRVYLQDTRFPLDPGETKAVRLMVEYIVDDEVLVPPDQEQYLLQDATVRIEARLDTPDTEPEQIDELLGGATLKIGSGRATEFRDLVFDPSGGGGFTVSGRVVRASTGDAITVGKVLVAAARGAQARPEETYRNISPGSDGRFTVRIPDGSRWLRAEVTYLGATPFADTATGLVDLPN